MRASPGVLAGRGGGVARTQRVQVVVSEGPGGARAGHVRPRTAAPRAARHARARARAYATTRAAARPHRAWGADRPLSYGFLE